MIEYKSWIKNFKIIKESDLVVTWSDIERFYYKCPCGMTEDHYAVRSFYPYDDPQYNFTSQSKLSPVLNCYETNQQWLVKEQEIDIAGQIRQEEENYLNLLNNAGPVVEKVTKKKGKNTETIKYLKDTHGIDEEFVREIWELQ